MSDATNEIAKRLGTAFAVATARFMPTVTEGLLSKDGAELTFGTTVKLKNVEGVVVGTMKLHEPKIPTATMDSIPFVLKRDEKGELSWLYEGKLDDMKAEAAELQVAEQEKAQPHDGYTPGANRQAKETPESGK